MFDSFVGLDQRLNIRWITNTDPVFFAAANRPIADVVVRQLVLAKAVDSLQLQLGHQVLYPFIVQPMVASGTTEVEVPTRWIWDFHASLPKKWQNLRLAKIKRISGENSSTNGYTGILRLIFTANVVGSETEVAIFSADYQIDSVLTYQLISLEIVDSTEENISIDSGESQTVAGNLIFRTLDTELQTVQQFLNVVAPPDNPTDVNNDNIYDIPAVYELSDTISGSSEITGDYSPVALSHGTGLMTDSSFNLIPELDSDIQSWITAFNYPFDSNANRRSTDGITIPNGIFREFNITAPAGDEPEGNTSGLFYPVWISRIERVDSSGSQLRFYFATYNITDDAPSTNAVEFASLDLLSNYTDGQSVEIIPINNLLLKTGSDADNWEQGFGRGHVVLSSLWNGTTSDISDFFDAFDSLTGTPADTTFSRSSTRISAFAISRVPKYIPTRGQSQALLGSTSRLSPPIHPSSDNRYITELDQGIGKSIDLEAQPGISPNPSIERYGYSGGLAHRTVKLVINATDLGSSSTFYDTNVLPRLRILLGRDPIFGDEWYNGTRFMRFNGDTWQG